MPSVVHHVVQTQPAGGTKNIVPPCAQKLAKCKHDESINHALLYGLPFASVAMRIFGGDIYQRDDHISVSMAGSINRENTIVTLTRVLCLCSLMYDGRCDVCGAVLVMSMCRRSYDCRCIKHSYELWTMIQTMFTLHSGLVINFVLHDLRTKRYTTFAPLPPISMLG